jgi:hypothetical protein
MFIDSLVCELNYEPQDPLPQCLFFADDGLLLCNTLSVARNQLFVAERWAKQNGMTYNVAKCAVICTLQSPTVGKPILHLCNIEIPVVQQYKYLGFPVTAVGIDFVQHLNIQTESATSFLKFMQVQCSEWTPYTRYIIYSTFLRPKLEYGAPLTYAFKEVSKLKDMFVSIQKLQNESVAWIFHSNTNKIKLLHGILGALTVQQRFSHLRCSFQLHIDHTALTNPIRNLISSSQPNQYLFTLRTDQLYEQFQTLSDLPPSYPALKYRMSGFLLSQRSIIISQSKSVLINYIPKTARTDGLVDKVLTAPIFYQNTFLSWRRGALFLNNKCICGNRWNRGHITCLPKVALNFIHQNQFIKSQKEMSTNFCELDYLLNVQMWDIAFETIKSWEQAMDRVKVMEC